MSHMEAQADLGNWIEFEDPLEGRRVVEAEWEDDQDIVTGPVTDKWVNVWFSRLSAPGYLDCTAWEGPYHTEEGALYGLYESLGSDDSETYFSFIGDDKWIIQGSLRVTGRENHLYGRPLGEKPPVEIWLAQLGDIDLDEETGETFPYDPNEDHDLPEAYEFRLIDPKSKRDIRTKRWGYLSEAAAELLDRLECAKRDSEWFVSVEVFIGWTDYTWTTRYSEQPAEISDNERTDRAIAEILHALEPDPNAPTLPMDLPTVAFTGIYHMGIEEFEWSEIDTPGYYSRQGDQNEK